METLKNVKLTGANDKPFLLDAYYTANNKKKPVIVFCHGFKGFKDWGTFHLIAERFAKEDFVFIKFNFTHNGTTIENPEEVVDTEAFANNNFNKELEDLDSVLHWVQNNDLIPETEFDTSQIYLIGHSRGGAVALIKAAESKSVSKIITWASPYDLKYGWDDEEVLLSWKEEGVKYVENKRTGKQLPMYFQIVEDFFNNRERFNLKKNVEYLDKPMMVIHGTEDEAVPFEHAIEMKRWNKSVNLELIPHANHTFGGSHPYAKKELPYDANLIIDLSIKFLKGIPERRRRKRT